jgi:serine/threonine protein kinase
MLFLDLKPQNILVDRKAKTVVLGDFGVARALTNTSGVLPTKGPTGTPCYQSPEQSGARPYEDKDDAYDSDNPDKFEKMTVKTDVWTFGTTLLHMLSGKVPWSDKKRSNVAIVERLQGWKKPKRDLPENTPIELVNLVKICLTPNPSKRPTFANICVTLEQFAKTLPTEEKEDEDEDEGSKDDGSNSSAGRVDSDKEAEIKQLKEEVRKLKEGKESKKSKVKSDSSSPSDKFNDAIDSDAQINLGELDREISKIEEREKSAESPIDRVGVLSGLKQNINNKRKDTKEHLERLKKQEETKQQESDTAGEKEEWDKSEKLDAEIEACQKQQTALEENTKQEISELESQL